ncbi:Uncharacterized protein SCF082_LOCUS4952 [Durusdinium trenchii]|uniref:Uncharacterized protein n=1 Tax=Durusdinium trenchii TaxID=1381693 RepID=A0ABP0I2M6_9DINO
MSLVDSEAVFKSRAVAIGLTDEVIGLLRDCGLTTMGKLAFASSYVPGSSDDAPFVTLVKTALKRDPTISEMAGIRRIFNESYAAASLEMKSLVEQSEEAPVRKLAAAERAERFREQQRRLKGIKIQGQQEPGDSLVDLADPLLSFDSSGTLKVAKKDSVTPCDVSSELHVRYCLVRRGLAMEQANLLAFEKHDTWCELLFHRKMTDAPPGYNKVSFKQLQLADARLFVVLGEATRDGIKVTADGKRPCDLVFEQAMNHAEVQHLLQPMPSTSKPHEIKEDKSTDFHLRTRKTVLKNKGKGAGKQGKNTWRPSIPQELLAMGCVGTTNRGNPLCFNYQLGKCSLQVQNQKCPKGLHLCAMPRCHKNHAAKDCPDGRKRERFCDGSHEHEEWGLDDKGNFNTAKEAQYPQAMCEAYFKAVNVCRKIPQLVPEFAKVITKVLRSVPRVDHKQLLITPCDDVPPKARLLRTEAKQGSFLCVFGVYHSPEQFVAASRSLKRPFDDLIHVPDLLLQCVFDFLTLGPLDFSKRRVHTLLKWKQWAEELKAVEESIHEKLPEHLRTILAGKRFALLKKIATEMQWPDTNIHKELINGFRLVGVGTRSNIFREDERPAAISEEELMSASKYLKPKLIRKIRNAPIAEYNAELNQITANEADQKNWLEGPFDEQHIDKIFDSKWLPVERFAVRQKEKLRPIDNFASNGVNEAWGNVEKIDLHALDQLTWTIAVICKVAHERGHVEIPLKNGSLLTGRVHQDWNAKKLSCKITALDMKDAYKQLGIHSSGRCRSVVSLRNDSKGRVDHYLTNCLPFGAVGSVHHFNRLARLLWGIGLHFLMLPWVNYFDDFPLISPCEIKSRRLQPQKHF